LAVLVISPDAGLTGSIRLGRRARPRSSAGEYVESFKTAWGSLVLLANGPETKRAKPGARVDGTNNDVDLAAQGARAARSTFASTAALQLSGDSRYCTFTT
jgi:hypothetical protein